MEKTQAEEFSQDIKNLTQTGLKVQEAIFTEGILRKYFDARLGDDEVIFPDGSKALYTSEKEGFRAK
jgi:hypothetical protein